MLAKGRYFVFEKNLYTFIEKKRVTCEHGFGEEEASFGGSCGLWGCSGIFLFYSCGQCSLADSYLTTPSPFLISNSYFLLESGTNKYVTCKFLNLHRSQFDR